MFDEIDLAFQRTKLEEKYNLKS